MKNTKPMQPSSLMVLCGAMLFCGCVALYYGKDIGTDLANYHFFIPYEFFHQRLSWDYWPASYPHAYFAPTADFLCYGLIKFCSAKQAVFIAGAIHGINLWLLFLLAKQFLPSVFAANVFAGVMALLGMYGPFGWTAIGDFSADHLSSIFVLGFVLLQVDNLKNTTLSTQKSLLAGGMLGIAMGLKLTVVLFGLGAIVALFFLTSLTWSQRLRLVLMVGLGMLLGDLVISGYWLTILWLHFHNPIYPFLDNIFNHQSSVPELRGGYTALQPQGLLKKLFYPFYFSYSGNDERSFRDFRLLGVYVLFIVLVLKSFISKINSTTISKLELPVLWLFLFFGFSYAIGQIYFASLRYMLALEMLAPLVIYLLISGVIKSPKIRVSLTLAIFYGLALTMYPTYFPLRVRDYQSTYLNVTLPVIVQQTPQALVLLAYPGYGLELSVRPFAYLIPFFPQKWQFIGVGYLHGKSIATAADVAHIRQLIKANSAPMYLLTSTTIMPNLMNSANAFGLVANGPCATIDSARQNFTGDAILCPVVKL